MEVNTRNPVPGEQIIASVLVYFKEGVQVTSYQPVPGWKAEGFWKERLETDQPETEIVIRNGVRYKKAELVEYALFPTRSGTLSLSSYKVAFAVRVSSSGRDPFSSFFGARQKRLELKTDPVQIDVESLPELDDARYLGAVGDFQVSRSINKKQVRVGQTIELTTRINGQGNIPLISKPDYQLPNSFETYAPKESSSINKDGRAIKGKKSFTDVLIPRKAGTYTIPGVRVAYYSTRRQDYNVKFLPPIEIKVDPNLAAAGGSSNGIPIQPVSGAVDWQQPSRTMLIQQWWFWAALAVPPLFLLVGFWQKRYREKLSTDRDFARYENAWENAKERLSEARSFLEQDATKEVYSTLHQALTMFIGDKLSLSEAGLSDEVYIRELKNHNLDNELLNAVQSLLEKCATIRYAPNPSGKDLQADIQETERVIKQLKKKL
jgi:hypothetical protein